MASSSTNSTDYQRIVSEGLRALQQKKYDEAIALLKPVMGDRQSPGSARLKAALGLFQAYGEAGQTAAAQTLGTQLKNHKNAQVRDRAVDLWNRLYPEAVPTSASNSGNSGNLDGSNSGFMPMEPGSDLPAANPNFQPLSAEPPTRKVVRPQRQRPPVPVPPLPVKGTAKKTTKKTAKKTAIAPPGPEQTFKSTAPSPPPPLPPPAPRQRIVVTPDALNGQGVSPNAVTDAGADTAAEPIEETKFLGPQAYEPQWRNGEKISRWGTLPGAPGLEYQGLQWLSVVAFGAIATLPFIALAWLYNWFLYVADGLPGVNSLDLIYMDWLSFMPVWVLLAGILVATPWLLDEALTRLLQAKALRLLDLSGQRPEAGRLLQRQCRRHKLVTPQLYQLPTADPVLFSYGSWRSNARIVISQGLLDAVDDGELATLLGAELGHILNGDCRVMGWGLLLLAVPFGAYWGSAMMIDRWKLPVPRALAVAMSAISYDCFRLGRWPLFWLSRSRVGFGDRQGVLMTGDPNGLSRALVKVAIAITERVHTQKSLPPLLELTQFVLPVPPSQAIALGSLYPHSPIEPYLQWERRNTYRHWLRSNSTHPTLGDRLFRLSQWAERWQLEPEWDLSSDRANLQSLRYIPRIGNAALPPTPFTLWSQSAPMVGVILGIVLGILLWMPGGIGEMLNLAGLDWMYGDRSLLVGLALVGFGCGTILRINSFFPDIKTLKLDTSGTPERPLGAELNDANVLPVNSRIVRLHGQLIGRPARYNLLGQDWWIQTETGTVKIHLGDRLGYLGKLIQFWTRPIKPNQPVTVVGWLRRGATPWMDVDILNHKDVPSHTLIKKSWVTIDGHPIWSTGLAIVTIALGLWILNRGI